MQDLSAKIHEVYKQQQKIDVNIALLNDDIEKL